MSRPFNDVLNECIERLLQGGCIEDCLSRYPNQAAQLEPLLRVAHLTARAAAVAPRPEFRAAARERLAVRVADRRRPTPIPSRRIRSGLLVGLFHGGSPERSLVAAAAVLLVALLSSGALAASASSLPDEPLYPVKLAAEQIQLAVAPNNSARAQLYADYAARRLAETETVLARHGQIAAPIAEAGARQAERAAEFVEQVQPENRDAVLQQVAGVASRQESVLSAVIERAPAEAKPGLERALEASRRGREKAAQAMEGPIPVPVKPEATAVTTPPARATEPGEEQRRTTQPAAKPDDKTPHGEATQPAGLPGERNGQPAPAAKPNGKPDDRTDRQDGAGRGNARGTPTPTPGARGRGDDRSQRERQTPSEERSGEGSTPLPPTVRP